MALANFFDRAATAASQVLAGFDLAAFRGELDARRVGLAFDAAAARSPEGAATLDLAVRLLARLHPSLGLFGVGRGSSAAAASLEALARAINPAIEISREVDAAVWVGVGTTRPRVRGDVIFVGSDGWAARVSRTAPVGSGTSRNPFGAGAAACLAAANVFRAVFADRLQGGGPDAEASLSLLGYGAGPAGGDPLPDSVDLGDSHLVGLGAIGNGAVWALSRITGLVGTLNLVDHEGVDLSNLQRYVLADQTALGVPKVDLAAEAFHRTGLAVRRHRLRWGDYVGGVADGRLDRVAVALDTAEDRLGVQASLPAWVANAWTRDIDLGVSRHEFLSGNACLACLYLPDGKVRNEDERVAEEIGLPDAVMEVRELLATGRPVDHGFVARVAARLGVPEATLAPFAGQPLRSFHAGALCGGVVFRHGDGARAARATVPMAFQSALAGLMLAAELVRRSLGLPEPSTTSTRVNLLRPLSGHYADPRARDPSGRCICHDADYVEAYRRKYA